MWMTIDEAIRLLSGLMFKGKLKEALDMAIKALKQEPKIGHWNDIPKYENIAWLCSECEHFTTMKHKYCPNCGAKMVEP